MKKILTAIIAISITLSNIVSVSAYNIIDLPKTMTMADAFGIFNADEIISATITSLKDDRYITLSADEINDFYYSACNMELVRTINPTPFRDIAINLKTASDTVSYYIGSGVQIGLYGQDNYVCYKATGTDAQNLLYLETLYHDSTQKQNGAELNRATIHDFLSLPSAQWAVPVVQEAAKNSLLPYNLTKKYSAYISREEFCQIIGQFITVQSGYADLDSYVIAKKGAYLQNAFNDCDGKDSSIDMLYALGIVTGKSSTTFDPDGALTREEAATVITRAAELFTFIDAQNSISYTDNSQISSWADYYVRWVTQSGLMTGTDQNAFEPKAYYTVEQAIATINRLYNYLAD